MKRAAGNFLIPEINWPDRNSRTPRRFCKTTPFTRPGLYWVGAEELLRRNRRGRRQQKKDANKQVIVFEAVF